MTILLTILILATIYLLWLIFERHAFGPGGFWLRGGPWDFVTTRGWVWLRETSNPLRFWLLRRWTRRRYRTLEEINEEYGKHLVLLVALSCLIPLVLLG